MRDRMATSAQLRNLFAINLAFPPSLAAHGSFWIVAGGVASVAAGTRQTLLCVYVFAEFLLAHSQGIGQGGMTIQAGVLGLPEPQARCERYEGGQLDTAGCAGWSELISQDGHRHSYQLCTQEQRLPIQ